MGAAGRAAKAAIELAAWTDTVVDSHWREVWHIAVPTALFLPNPHLHQARDKGHAGDVQKWSGVRVV